MRGLLNLLSLGLSGGQVRRPPGPTLLTEAGALLLSEAGVPLLMES